MSDTSAPLQSTKTPVGTSRASVIAIVLALGLTALGVLAVRDALVAAGVLTGSPWLSGPVDALDGLTAGVLVAVAGLLLVAVGLWLVASSIRPRRPAAVGLRADTGVFLRPGDVSRLAETAAEDVDGVLGASVSSTTKTVTVRVRTTGDTGTQQAVQQAVTERLHQLEREPAVRVRVRSDNHRNEEQR